MEDMITVVYPCGCEVDFEELRDVTDACPLCDHYLFDEDEPFDIDYAERMEERRQMGLSDF